MKNFRFLSILLCLSLVFGCLTFPVRATESQPETQTETQPETQTETSADTEPTIPDVKDMPFGTVSIYNGCRTIEGMVPLAGSDRKLETAQSAFLYEVNTGTVVYAYNPDMKVTAGGLVKLVNAAVVLEKVDLDEIVTLTGDIYNYGSGLNYNLRRDEQMSVETLLYIMLLYGANDAAIGLADYVAGNQMNFTQLMNEWVKNIGCTSTEFGNVHGLTSANCSTTARDMAKILMKVMENEEIKKILSALSYKVPPDNINEKERGFRTSNYMIDKGTLEDFYDTRVKGGMACFNQEIGASVVVWANNIKEAPIVTEETTETTEAPTETTVPDESTEPKETYPPELEVSQKPLEYIGVVMNAQRTFDPVDTWKAVYYGNFNEMTKLIKLGFDNYKSNRIVYDGMVLDQVSIIGGESNVVGMAKVNIDSVVPAAAHMDNIYRIFTAKEDLKAPIKAGDLIGTMQLTYRDSVIAEAEVYAMGGVSATGKNGVSIRSTASRNDGDGGGVLSMLGTIAVIILGIGVAYLTFNAYMRARIRARRRQRRADRRRTR